MMISTPFISTLPIISINYLNFSRTASKRDFSETIKLSQKSPKMSPIIAPDMVLRSIC